MGCGTRHLRILLTNPQFMRFWKNPTLAKFLCALLLSLFFTNWNPIVSFAQGTDTTPITLRFVTMKADNRIVWDEAITRFEKAHPHITIAREIAPHSSTAYHDLLTQKLKNQDPSMDLFLMDVIWPAEFAAAGWALPLDTSEQPESPVVE